MKLICIIETNQYKEAIGSEWKNIEHNHLTKSKISPDSVKSRLAIRLEEAQAKAYHDLENKC